MAEAKPKASTAQKTKGDLQLREQQLYEVGRLDRMGLTQTEIAERLGISQPQVSYNLKQIRERYFDAMIEDRAVLIAEKREQLRDLYKEAFLAWEKSQKQKRKLTTKEGQRGEQLFQEEIEEVTDTPGDPQWIALLADLVKQEREMLGLDQPKQIQQTGSMTINWGAMTGPSPKITPEVLAAQQAAPTDDDPIEQRIQNEMRRLGHEPGVPTNGTS